MFSKNEEHKQSKMFTAVDYLPQTVRKRLESSWASVFYEEFCSHVRDILSADQVRPDDGCGEDIN